MPVSCGGCVTSDRDLFDRPITRPEKSYRQWSVREWSWDSIMRRFWPIKGQVRHGKKSTCNSSHSRLSNLKVSQHIYPSSVAITYTTLFPIFNKVLEHICCHLALACHIARSVLKVRVWRLLGCRFTYCYYEQGQRIWISGEKETFCYAVTRKHRSDWNRGKRNQT